MARLLGLFLESESQGLYRLSACSHNRQLELGRTCSWAASRMLRLKRTIPPRPYSRMSVLILGLGVRP